MNIHKTDIEWCSHTWNPVTGCKHGCEYCYARRMVSRFGPHPCERPIIEPLEVLPKGTGCYYVEQLPSSATKPGSLCALPRTPRVLPPPITPTPWTILRSGRHLRGSSSPAWETCSGSGCRTSGLRMSSPPASERRSILTCSSPRTRRGILTWATPGSFHGAELLVRDHDHQPETEYFGASCVNTFLSIEPLLEPFSADDCAGFRRLGELFGSSSEP